MTSQEVNQYILDNPGKSSTELAKDITEQGYRISARKVRERRQRHTKKIEPTREATQSVEEQIEHDLKAASQQVEERDETKKYKRLLVEHNSLKDELEATLQIQAHTTSYTIKPVSKNGSESTAVTIWSDWHLEERVEPDTVNDLNEFNLDIAKKRTEKLFRKCVDFVKMYQQDTAISEMIIALLGDFISNDIHEENSETAQLLPIDAIIFAQTQIISGIEYILENTNVNLTIPCHSGNHARTTKKVHVSTEAGHSLEYLMYWNLKNYFKGNDRVNIIIPRSYLSYVQVYNYLIRFHHGHDIKYGGGIGGLFIPTYKAISQWNKGRVADLDCFGHWHQTKDGGNFYCNGSLIGFNPYAISIKADYEAPRQNFFLVHKELGRTIMSPIHL